MDSVRPSMVLLLAFGGQLLPCLLSLAQPEPSRHVEATLDHTMTTNRVVATAPSDIRNSLDVDNLGDVGLGDPATGPLGVETGGEAADIAATVALVAIGVLMPPTAHPLLTQARDAHRRALTSELLEGIKCFGRYDGRC